MFPTVSRCSLSAAGFFCMKHCIFWPSFVNIRHLSASLSSVFVISRGSLFVAELVVSPSDWFDEYCFYACLASLLFRWFFYNVGYPVPPSDCFAEYCFLRMSRKLSPDCRWICGLTCSGCCIIVRALCYFFVRGSFVSLAKFFRCRVAFALAAFVAEFIDYGKKWTRVKYKYIFISFPHPITNGRSLRVCVLTVPVGE